MTRLSSAFLIGSFLMVYCFPSQAGGAGICIEVIEASLNEGSPKATLEKHFNCEHYEGSAYERIASGSRKWVRLAERMLQYSDACYTEGIQASLGKAMQKAPENVLPLVDKAPTLAASYICLPFISSELPIEQQQAEVEKSRRSIQGVHDQKLHMQKATCLKFIQSVNLGASPKHP